MPVRDFPAPASERWLARAQAWLADPTPGPEIRGAATVMLVRDAAPGGIEVYVLRRVASMEFAPSMYVFPGGGVDPQDHTRTFEEGFVSAFVEQMRMPPAQVAVILAAAVREVEEEVGVRLDPADLRPRAHWVTPAFEPRRYDTWFFIAPVPPDQQVRAQTSESDHARWVAPADLLHERATGQAAMLPPTLVMLEALAAHRSVAAALGEAPRLDLVFPELIETPTGYVMRANLP